LKNASTAPFKAISVGFCGTGGAGFGCGAVGTEATGALSDVAGALVGLEDGFGTTLAADLVGTLLI